MFTIVVSGCFAYVGRIYPPEADLENHELIISLYNPTEYNEKRATLSVYFPYIGLKGESGEFSLRSESPERAYVEVDFPETLEPGYYPVILLFENDDVREKEHAWIYIG